MTKTRLYGIT